MLSVSSLFNHCLVSLWLISVPFYYCADNTGAQYDEHGLLRDWWTNVRAAAVALTWVDQALS
jgi:hypothetical protein